MKVKFETTNHKDVAHVRVLLGSLGYAVMDLDVLGTLFCMQRERKKTQCIKIIRDVYGLDLRESKEWVEENIQI